MLRCAGWVWLHIDSICWFLLHQSLVGLPIQKVYFHYLTLVLITNFAVWICHMMSYLFWLCWSFSSRVAMPCVVLMIVHNLLHYACNWPPRLLWCSSFFEVIANSVNKTIQATRKSQLIQSECQNWRASETCSHGSKLMKAPSCNHNSSTLPVFKSGMGCVSIVNSLMNIHAKLGSKSQKTDPQSLTLLCTRWRSHRSGCT